MIKYGDKISIALISMNEEKAIKNVLESIFSIDKRIEVTLVDSSTDQTANIAKNLGANVIRQYPPIGYGPALNLALNSCTKKLIVTMDCDCTYPASEIDRVSKFIFEENYDCVDCNRLASKPKNMPLLNYLGNKFFSYLASIFFCRIIPDLHSGMRGYKRESLKFIKYNYNKPSLPVELLLAFIKKKFKVKIINIDYFEREGSSKMKPFETSIWTLIRIFKVRFFNNH
jgi:glycosyltransferase involved in cell wall biosynthesis